MMTTTNIGAIATDVAAPALGAPGGGRIGRRCTFSVFHLDHSRRIRPVGVERRLDLCVLTHLERAVLHNRLIVELERDAATTGGEGQRVALIAVTLPSTSTNSLFTLMTAATGVPEVPRSDSTSTFIPPTSAAGVTR